MIHDLIYLLEITDKDELKFSDKELYHLGLYLIKYLRDDHEMPGKIYYQMIGVCDWYKEKKFLTPKQQFWMKYALKAYIDQRDLMYEV
jgi:hypothetical protein